MVVYRHGNYWSEYSDSDLFVFTGNGLLKSNGALVMGAGTARQVRDKFLGIDLVIGNAIRKKFNSNEKNLYEYNFLVSEKWPAAKMGVFQSKLHFEDPSNLDLIQKGIDKLNSWCNDHPKSRIDIPMPGVGHGELPIDKVKPLLDNLSDNVNVWTI